MGWFRFRISGPRSGGRRYQQPGLCPDRFNSLRPEIRAGAV